MWYMGQYTAAADMFFNSILLSVDHHSGLVHLGGASAVLDVDMELSCCMLSTSIVYNVCRLDQQQPVRYGSHLEGKVLNNFEL